VLFNLAYKRSTFYRQFAATHGGARRTPYRRPAKHDMIAQSTEGKVFKGG
jgi:hypothetical protein